jgi:hypothetical protein
MKKIIAVLLVLIFMVFLAGCNRQMIDTTYHFNYCTIYSPSGEVIAQGEVQSWKDFEDGDQLQVKIDGVIYLTHASNVILEDR